jgi:hypothetical protein
MSDTAKSLTASMKWVLFAKLQGSGRNLKHLEQHWTDGRTLYIAKREATCERQNTQLRNGVLAPGNCFCKASTRWQGTRAKLKLA